MSLVFRLGPREGTRDGAMIGRVLFSTSCGINFVKQDETLGYDLLASVLVSICSY